jgi:hypothetical protein
VLHTLQTHGIYPSPQTVQQIWSNSSRRRYPKAWEGAPLDPIGYTLEWQPREIACGHCGRSLGEYVAYRAALSGQAGLHQECGFVERTTRHYQSYVETAPRQAGRRGPRLNPRFWLEGEVGRRASKTTACFRCPGCKRQYRRNLARLGDTLFDDKPESTFLLK